MLTNQAAAGSAPDEASRATSRGIDFLTVLLRSKVHVAVVLLASIVMSLLYIQNATYKYRAQLRLTPAESSNGGQARLGQLGGLAAVAGISLPTGDSSPFILYIEGVTSSIVAAKLVDRPDLVQVIFGNEWDEANRRFVEPTSTLRSISQGVKSLIGFPVYAWEPPNEARMRDYLLDNVTVIQTLKSPVITLQYDNQDPEFAKRFLTAVHRALDSSLREKARLRSEQNIAYLSSQLQRVTLAEHRAAVAQALSEQVKARMLANSSMSYAADPFGSATASVRPVSPKPMMILMLGIVLGLMAALLVVVARWHWANYRLRSSQLDEPLS